METGVRYSNPAEAMEYAMLYRDRRASPNLSLSTRIVSEQFSTVVLVAVGVALVAGLLHFVCRRRVLRARVGVRARGDAGCERVPRASSASLAVVIVTVPLISMFYTIMYQALDEIELWMKQIQFYEICKIKFTFARQFKR